MTDKSISQNRLMPPRDAFIVEPLIRSTRHSLPDDLEVEQGVLERTEQS
jgi:hypothetical protein